MHGHSPQSFVHRATAHRVHKLAATKHQPRACEWCAIFDKSFSRVNSRAVFACASNVIAEWPRGACYVYGGKDTEHAVKNCIQLPKRVRVNKDRARGGAIFED